MDYPANVKVAVVTHGTDPQPIGEGIRSVLNDAEIALATIAGERITLPTTTASGALTEASYIFDRDSATAFIDASAALATDAPTGDNGDSYGLGVLVADAASRGARQFIVSLSGLTLLDGGAGVLVALGVPPLNAQGQMLPKGGAALADLDDFDTAKLNVPAAAADWIFVTDTEGGVDTTHPGMSRLIEFSGVDPTTSGMGAGGALPVALTWLSSVIHGSADHVRLVSREELIDANLIVISGLPTSAFSATLVVSADEGDDLAEQGKQAAVDYLTISTVQGK